ncbi:MULTISPECIES: phage protein NinX family protein [Vibrio]|uniref:phage protein NinX family protein n=1 Tax=Vibrio TaxID=662 RepID=UPI00078D58FF|nr:MULTISPECIES: phage protein NinX family protein [Vibrio]BAU70891.1 hypothetical protein [Vibrio sp. 04Ya108]BBM67852.1 hypothetical protein VA249_44980 [Vibrio alfacsensis]BCN27022.1 hypothetical protein VYA_42140 [Vibrio alfacsensis]
MNRLHPNQLNHSALDYAVAVAQNLPILQDPMGFASMSPNPVQAGYWIWFGNSQNGTSNLIGSGYSPSTDWRIGGGIIDAHNISIIEPSDDNPLWTSSDPSIVGETALIAAMRFYVLMTLGESVEVPDMAINDQGVAA